MQDYEWPMPTWFPERGQVQLRLMVLPRQFMPDSHRRPLGLPAQAASRGSRPQWACPLPQDLIAEVARWVEGGAPDALDDGTGRLMWNGTTTRRTLSHSPVVAAPGRPAK